jgi:hypothetical protein
MRPLIDSLHRHGRNSRAGISVSYGSSILQDGATPTCFQEFAIENGCCVH